MSINPFRASGLKHGANDNSLYATAYGATGAGSPTDDTVFLQAWLAAGVVGNYLMLPAGNFYVTDTLTVPHNFNHIEGVGTYATRITFNPASAKPLFKIDQGASSTYGFSAKNILLIGQGTQTKTAFDLYDCRTAELEDIWIYSGWTSSGTSIGVRTRGREFVRLNRVHIEADRPVLMSPNANFANIGADHYHFSDTYLAPTPGSGRACIEIEDGVPVFNLVIDGSNSWIIDKYGLYWSDTTTVTASANISIKNVRCEQAVDATGYGIYIDSNTASPIQNMRLENVYTASAQNGLLIKGVKMLTLDHVETTNTTGNSLILDRITNFKIEDCFWQDGGTATLTGLVEVVSMPKDRAGAPLPPWGWYSDTTAAAAKAARLGTGITLLGQTFLNTTTPSASPVKWDTNGAWTGANEMVGFYNNASRKSYVDGNGNYWAGTTVDTATATGMFVGAFNASSLQLGKAAAGVTVAGLLQTALPAKANNTIASAATIAPTALVTHITGTVTIQTITAPTPLAQTNGGGVLHLVFDGIAPWNAAGNIFVAGTPTTAGTSVTFIYDNATAKWYPSRTL